MTRENSYPFWLAPLYKRVPFARFLFWQARFLTVAGARKLGYQLVGRAADQVTFEREGVRWTVNLRDQNIGLMLFMGDLADSLNVGNVLAWARAHGRLPQCDTILDIGANIGTTTIPLLLKSACRVVSVEPVPANLALLKQNLAQNNLLERVTLIERAITDRAETVRMIVTPVAFGGSEIDRGGVHRPEAIFQQPTETISVTTTRLDDLIGSLAIAPARVAFVWCDVQGSEGAVVRTGAPLWAAGVPLWAEIAPVLLERQGSFSQFLQDITRQFQSYVTLRELTDMGPHASPHPIDDFPALAAALTGEQQTDVLFLPR